MAREVFAEGDWARMDDLRPSPQSAEVIEDDRKNTVEACKAAAKEMGFTHGGPKGLLAALGAVLEEK